MRITPRILFPVLLCLLLCSCAAPRPPVQRAASILPAVSPAVAPSGPAILALSPMPNPPATDWRAYYASGAVQWFISSNACAAWRLSYTSNASCWLHYNHRPDNGGKLEFGGPSTNNFVHLSGFVRVSGELPSGANTIEIPMPRESAGFVTLKTEP
jgi:hypothetical protein